ncbi:MAG: 2-isopropylmalate synthase [Terriglobales bacterium]
MDRAKITIFDTTLRDGEQSPGCSMNLREKLCMARQLDRLGVDVIEAGFPIASQGDYEAVEAIAKEIRRPRIAGLARARKEDIDRCWEALRHAAHPFMHVFLATSDIHLDYKLKMTREQCLKQSAEMVAYARSFAPEVEFSAEDAMRTDVDFLIEVIEAVVKAGAQTVNLPDTVGYNIPSEMQRIFGEICKRIHKKYPDVVISTHCHDDLGLAVANSIAAVQAGARQIECTINGIGERAGNASLEEVVMALNIRRDVMPFETSIHTDQLYPSSQLLTELTGVSVQPNKAVVGRNAFAHEAGIHQDGVIKNPLTYEIMTPQSVGVPTNTLVLGKHSGRHALGKRCEQLGYQFSRRELDSVYKRFVALADAIKVVHDKELLQIIQQEISGTTAVPSTTETAPHRTVGGTAGIA